MTIGIGAIVFLVSIGYGLQQLVVTRIARLDEIRQADVVPQAGGKVKITDKTLADIQQVPKVQSVLPVIAVVGRINYQSSISDVAVYGVTSDYLEQSAVKTVEGKVFDSNEISISFTPEEKVAGVSDEKTIASSGDFIRSVKISVEPGEWVRIRSVPDTTGKIVGYSRRQEAAIPAVEVWGEKYSQGGSLKSALSPEGDPLLPWIKANLPLWEKTSCQVEEEGCEEGRYKKVVESGQQVFGQGYVAEINVQVLADETSTPRVLGDEIVIDELAPVPNVLASESAIIDQGDDWVQIASEAGIVQAAPTQTVDLAATAKRQAVVNRAMLKVLGLKETEAVGKNISTSFVVVGDLLGSNQNKTESSPSEYTIVGVVPDDKSPVMYVPFTDLRGLGIVNYSQIKLAAVGGPDLDKIRRSVESMGFVTRSVADTVSQVNSLFATLRTVLALLGMVALAVASLGMFNTLTVSLLERTREVGLMKAMGMKSHEVKELFLTESMIMGFFGGTIGVGVGIVAGKLLGVFLSLFAVMKGVGFVDVSYVPPLFMIVVIMLSLIVGILTGIYPARRATKISALNALRYE